MIHPGAVRFDTVSKRQEQTYLDIRVEVLGCYEELDDGKVVVCHCPVNWETVVVIFYCG